MSDLTRHMRYRARNGYLAMRRSLSAVVVDRRQGIETAHEANLADFGLHDAERVRYEPSGWMDLRRILKARDVSPDDVFADLGSGKGRVVLQAARYEFRRVIGVEIAAELTAVAQANVDSCRIDLTCRDIELVTADVLEYQLPADVTVAYLYNPFRGDIFARFVTRLLEDVDRDPRPLRLIYSTPMEHELLMRTGRFRVIREARGFRPGREWSSKLSIRMYELQPPGSTPG